MEERHIQKPGGRLQDEIGKPRSIQASSCCSARLQFDMMSAAGDETARLHIEQTAMPPPPPQLGGLHRPPVVHVHLVLRY